MPITREHRKKDTFPLINQRGKNAPLGITMDSDSSIQLQRF